MKPVYAFRSRLVVKSFEHPLKWWEKAAVWVLERVIDLHLLPSHRRSMRHLRQLHKRQKAMARRLEETRKELEDLGL